MRIDTKSTAIFEFTSEEYFICESDDKMLGDYSLNYRIDRSEKGKSDDIGSPVIYITKLEADALFKAGFAKTF